MQHILDSEYSDAAECLARGNSSMAEAIEGVVVSGRNVTKGLVPPLSKYSARCRCTTALRGCMPILLVSASPAIAQWTPPGGSGTVSEPKVFEGSELYRTSSADTFSLPSVEFGDSWSHDTGELSFQQNDVEVAGNNSLALRIRRSRSRTALALFSDGMFGDWELDLPRIEYTWRDTARAYFEPTRCRNPAPAARYYTGATSGIIAYDPGHFFFGMRAFDLEGSSHLLLVPSSQWPSGTLGAAPVLTTKSMWKISCLPSVTNGRDGFLATASDGTTYRFDKEVHSRRIKQNGNILVSIYPSTITDVHGNSLTFTYGAHGPTRMQSSDGRIFDILYNAAGQITRVTSAGRIWNYIYENRGGRTFLARVQQPDGREWQYQSFENLDWANYADRDYLDCQLLGPEFGSFPRPAAPVGPVSVIHPNGTRFEANFALIKNGRTKGPARTTNNYWYSNRCRQSVHTLDNYFVSLGLVQKRIIQGSGQNDTWSYAYSLDEGSYAQDNTLPDMKTRIEYKPDGTRTEYDVWRVNSTNNSAYRDEGDIIQTRVYSAASGGTLIERSYPTYNLSWLYVPGSPQLPATFDGPSSGNSVAKEVWHRLDQARVIERGSDVFTTAFAYTTSGTGFALNYPTTIQKSSNLGPAIRTSNITYQSQAGTWVLFQPQVEVLNGAEVARLTYSAKGQVTEVRSFGSLRRTFGWHPDGTMAWVRDPLNRQTSFASYKRGIPQSITQADGSTYGFVVDDNGWVTSATNPRGFTTAMTYNSVGWPIAVDRPAGWADTAIDYTWLPGGITVTETTGTRRTVTTHDGKNRPTLVRIDDLTAVSPSVYQKSGYDGLDRVVFKGLPSESSTSTTGTNVSYDALGREVQSSENVAPFATTTTAYLSGNRVQVTDPVGNQTTTTKVGFAEPDDGYVGRIDQPLGVSTVMTHDTLGNLVSATQGDGATSATQSWSYDSQSRLCAHTTPETGTKRFEYDAADQLIAYAEGLAGTGCAALPVEKVQLAYDAVGRNTTTDFPGTTPDIVTTYDANGNVASVSRQGVNWTYSYNSLDLLAQERLQLDGRTYQFDYAYTGNGDLASATIPFAGTVALAPDGRGRPTGLTIGATQVASQGTYFANGAPKRMVYGNGLTFNATQDARQLTTASQTSVGTFNAVARNYAYDANGRVTSLTDNAVAGENRAFTYDALGRLATASGPWGAGSYTYDGLGNLRSWTQGTAAHSTVWDSVTNRPTSATTTVYGTRAIAHDARGNVTQLGGMSFVYDAANQPVTVSGNTSGTYTYDGNLKRVKQVVGGQTIYNVYSKLSGKIAVVDNATTTERNAIIDLGPASVRWNPVSGVEFTHLDHLGSPVAATSGQGGLLWRESYTPFGEKRIDPSVNRDKPSYTGHIDDASTGLTYMQARYYDPALGRFLSNDPVGFAEGGVEYFNRYAYVANDPINKVDPSGKCAGAVVGEPVEIVVCGSIAIEAISWGLAALAGVIAVNEINNTQEDTSVPRSQSATAVPASPNPDDDPNKPKRGVGGSGWRGDKNWKANVSQVRQGGTIEKFQGKIASREEARALIQEAKGKVDRIDGPHGGGNPHNYPHINYTTANGVKGTIRIQSL